MELSFDTLGEILETAGLYLPPAGEDADPYDSGTVGLRTDYVGRGMYGGPGCFGLTVASGSALARIMVAAGLVAGQRDWNDQESFDAMQLAEATSTDSMGRGMILYWPGWTITDVPEDPSA